MVESVGQTGIVQRLKLVFVLSAVNPNYPIEYAQTVGTIKDAQSFQLRQAKPTF